MPILNNLTVNEISGAPARCIELEVDANGVLKPSTSATSVVDFTGVTAVDEYRFASVYAGNQNISGSLDLSGIKKVGTYSFYKAFQNSGLNGTVKINAADGYPEGYSGDYAFYEAFLGTNITSAVIVDGIAGSSTYGHTAMNAFNGCPYLTTLTFDWSYISGGYAAQGIAQQCPSLTSVDVRKIVSISSTPTTLNGAPLRNAFNADSGVTVLDFASLSTVSRNGLSQAASGCANLANVYFRSLGFVVGDAVFSNFASGVTNCTFHFPVNMQAQIETMQGYSTTAPFGAVAGTVLFDLPSSAYMKGADNNFYERNAFYDTGSALAWYNASTGSTDISTGYGRTTPFYTSGTSSPVVGDTIYSDAACTVAITTISSIE